MEAEQTDAARVDDVSDRVGAGAVQVLPEFARFDELPARQVGFEGVPAYEVVLPAVPLVYPGAPGRV